MKRASLLAGLLVWMLGTGATAQSPSPEATDDWVALDHGRVAMPEFGFAVTFPDGWNVWEARPDTSPTRVMAVGDDTCSVSEWWMAPDLSPFDSVDTWVTAYIDWARDEIPDYDVSGVMLDLDVGRVGRIDLTRVESSQMGVKHGAKYLFSDGERWLALDCTSKTSLADDHWRSIAETFEFLSEND